MKKTGWHIMYSFDGEHDWMDLNRMIREESCSEEDFFQTEADYKQAVKEGWVTRQDGKTLIWVEEA